MTLTLFSLGTTQIFFVYSDATEEDEGVLLTVVFDGTISQSYLLLLDGKTFQEINYAYLPHNVPWSFHGMWFPEVY